MTPGADGSTGCAGWRFAADARLLEPNSRAQEALVLLTDVSQVSAGLFGVKAG
jgi:hypothetical protein